MGEGVTEGEPVDIDDTASRKENEKMINLKEELTERASDKLIADLIAYGNCPSPDQILALNQILACYTAIATGEKQGRFAFPLQTGAGKTRSIIAWLWAVHKLDLDSRSAQNGNPISVVVAASKVEALCDLKRALVEAGIPEEKIGLEHSYYHKAGTAAAFLNGERALPQGYASEPRTQHNEDRPFLLVTHQRVKGRDSVTGCNVFKGNPRSLLIWDETLLASESRAFEDWRIKRAIGFVELTPSGRTPLREEALAYLKGAYQKIRHEMARQKADPEMQPSSFRLPSLSGDQIDCYKRSLGSGEQSDVLRDLLDISQEELRVLADVEQGGGIVWFRISVPAELQSIVILDASHTIRDLVKYDKTIQTGDTVPDIVSYEDVEVHQLDGHSGKHTMEKEFNAKRGHCRVTLEAADVIKGIPENEGILLFTFKTKGKPDYKRILEQDLRAAGIDTEALIEVRLGEKTQLKPRFVFLTWGQETSLSKYSYCSNVFLLGILRRSNTDLAGHIMGQSGNLLRKVSNEEIREVLQGEISHVVYQALSRGSSRIIRDGKALPMQVYLIHPEGRGLREDIEAVMPGIHWSRWEGRHLVPKEREGTKVRPLAETIASYLNALPEGEDKLSVRKLKTDLDFGDIAPKTAQRALQMAINEGSSWLLKGRTVYRKYAFYFGGDDDGIGSQASSAPELT